MTMPSADRVVVARVILAAVDMYDLFSKDIQGHDGG